MLILLLACSSPPQGELVFVRGGVLAPGGPIAGDRAVVERPWGPGDEVRAAGLTATAPRTPECVTLFSVDLGDVSQLIAAGGDVPDTALAWSPDGRWLAVGSFRGEVLVIDGWSGEVHARRRLAEAMAKQVAWSPDGATLYAAEQSPDAWLHALDPDTLADRWTLRLADDVGSSTPPPGELLYGIYSLPAAFGLDSLPGGDLLVTASHGWNEGGARRNAAWMLRLSPEGAVRARWPERPASVILHRPRVDGDRVVVPVMRSADGEAPEGMPVGGVQVLRLPDLSPVAAITVPPLEPWFHQPFIWDAVDIEGREVLLGMGDGRVLIERLDEDGGATVRATATSGTPTMAGEVPIAASVGFGLLHEGEAIYATSNTNIPWGAAAPDLRPPAAHPGENTLWAIGLDGALRWTWHGEAHIAGVNLGDDGHTLLVGAGARVSDHREDLFGALLFDLAEDAGSGDERLVTTCPTEGPVFFQQRMSTDGRVAVAEAPFVREDGSMAGAYRVTVLR